MRRLTPLVKWAGGKTTLLTRIRTLIPDVHGTYYEPFLGGGAVFFDIQPGRAVLADTNAELIGMYTAVRDQPEDVMRLLDRHQAHVTDRAYFYALRTQVPDEMSPSEVAARFIYLNKTCYNGLYRVNRAGQFNVPLGRFATPPTLYDQANLLGVSALLQRTVLLRADYHEALAGAHRGDFVYLDPPYHPTSATANFTSYTPLGFGDDDQRALADEVHRLTKAGVDVLISNSDTPLIRTLYGRYVMEEALVGRAINSRVDRRKGAKELLIRNYEVSPKKSLSQSSRSENATALPVDNR